MISKLSSLAWSYFSVVALPAIGVTLAIALLPGAFASVVGLTSDKWGDADVTQTFFASYVGLGIFAVNAVTWAPFSEQIPRSRLLPLSSRIIAISLLIVPALLGALMNATILQTYNSLHSSTWPVFSTSCWFFVTSALSVAAAAWMRESRFLVAMLAPLTVAGWIFWIVTRFYPEGFYKPPQLWFDLTGVDVAVLACVFLLSVRIWLPAYQRYREGLAPAEWLLKLMEQNPVLEESSDDLNLKPFPSADITFLEMTRQQTRLLSFASEVICFGVVIVAAWLSLKGKGNTLEGIMVVASMFACMVGMIVGLFVTAQAWLKSVDGRIGDTLNTYFAVLPYSDADLGRLIIRSWLPEFRRLLSIFFASILAAFVLHLIISGPDNYLQHYFDLKLVQHLGPLGGVVWIAGIPLLMWTATGNFAAMVLAGRPHLALWSTVYFFSTIVIIMWAWHFGGDTGLWIGRALLFMITVVTSTAVAAGLLYYAAKRELISSRQTKLSAAAGVLLFVAAFLVVPGALYWKCIWAGVVLLAIIPVPGIPVAIAFNRHR